MLSGNDSPSCNRFPDGPGTSRGVLRNGVMSRRAVFMAAHVHGFSPTSPRRCDRGAIGALMTSSAGGCALAFDVAGGSSGRLSAKLQLSRVFDGDDAFFSEMKLTARLSSVVLARAVREMTM